MEPFPPPPDRQTDTHTHILENRTPSLSQIFPSLSPPFLCYYCVPGAFAGSVVRAWLVLDRMPGLGGPINHRQVGGQHALCRGPSSRRAPVERRRDGAI